MASLRAQTVNIDYNHLEALLLLIVEPAWKITNINAKGYVLSIDADKIMQGLCYSGECLLSLLAMS
jgi:hypothetical protein